MHLHAHSRDVRSLSGTWSAVPDQYEQFGERGAFGGNRVFDPAAADPPVDADVDEGYEVAVPGCWNEELPGFEQYEGAMWYATRFGWDGRSGRAFLRFGAVNYRADVYLNGAKLGSHEGGFTPFAFEVTDVLEPREDNLLVVRVDNDRADRKLPAERTDWFNFGGITREVELVAVPDRFVRNVKFEAAREGDAFAASVRAWVDDPTAAEGDGADTDRPEATLPALDRSWTLDPAEPWEATPHVGADEVASGRVYEGSVEVPADEVDVWSPEEPDLYDLRVETGADAVAERVGFRTVAVEGSDVLVNGDPVELRGVSLHEEADGRGRSLRAVDRRERFEWLADLNCNFARLAHYPHHPAMARRADEEGVLLWEEVPAYWWVDFDDPAVRANHRQQLRELVQRDWNRPSVVLWSVANETDASETARNEALPEAVDHVSELDDTRLVTAACFVDETEAGDLVPSDPLAAHLDVFGVNQYYGWYEGEAGDFARLDDDPSGPPIVVSEFGAGAKRGNAGPADERWTEQHQAALYREQLAVLDDLDQVCGQSPWILFDFRSPRRQNALQRGYNLKGLRDASGEKKRAFGVVRRHYRE
ncbi:MAG: glycoside hydrolase family 2 protein [Haloarculaceae archaeon]